MDVPGKLGHVAAISLTNQNVAAHGTEAQVHAVLDGVHRGLKKIVGTEKKTAPRTAAAPSRKRPPPRKKRP